MKQKLLLHVQAEAERSVKDRHSRSHKPQKERGREGGPCRGLQETQRAALSILRDTLTAALWR